MGARRLYHTATHTLPHTHFHTLPRRPTAHTAYTSHTARTAQTWATMSRCSHAPMLAQPHSWMHACLRAAALGCYNNWELWEYFSCIKTVLTFVKQHLEKARMCAHACMCTQPHTCTLANTCANTYLHAHACTHMHTHHRDMHVDMCVGRSIYVCRS